MHGQNLDFFSKSSKDHTPTHNQKSKKYINPSKIQGWVGIYLINCGHFEVFWFNSEFGLVSKPYPNSKLKDSKSITSVQIYPIKSNDLSAVGHWVNISTYTVPKFDDFAALVVDRFI